MLAFLARLQATDKTLPVDSGSISTVLFLSYLLLYHRRLIFRLCQARQTHINLQYPPHSTPQECHIRPRSRTQASRAIQKLYSHQAPTGLPRRQWEN